jgi:hypothetical protein
VVVSSDVLLKYNYCSHFYCDELSITLSHAVIKLMHASIIELMHASIIELMHASIIELMHASIIKLMHASIIVQLTLYIYLLHTSHTVPPVDASLPPWLLQIDVSMPLCLDVSMPR